MRRRQKKKLHCKSKEGLLSYAVARKSSSLLIELLNKLSYFFRQAPFADFLHFPNRSDCDIPSIPKDCYGYALYNKSHKTLKINTKVLFGKITRISSGYNTYLVAFIYVYKQKNKGRKF